MKKFSEIFSGDHDILSTDGDANKLSETNDDPEDNVY
jgi:hypothetical protein